MRKTIIATLSVISLLLLGCGTTSNEKTENQTRTDTHKEHQHDSESGAIELNNGEKWKVNAEMMPSIRMMEKEINTFSNSEQKDYKQLSVKLQEHIDVLTSSCTMKGKAHDELHKWLLPYIDMVNELSDTEDEKDAARIFGNIQNSFLTFNQYFQ